VEGRRSGERGAVKADEEEVGSVKRKRKDWKSVF